MIKVYLSDIKFRYDVFQIVNLFYNLETIKFVDYNADLEIFIEKDKCVVNKEDCSLAFESENNIINKEEIKLIVFNFLKKLTGNEFPWGTLIGIRPSKIALNLLDQGKSEEEIIEYYNAHFNTIYDKAKLCIDVAKLEKNFIKKDNNKVSIYIGMPFCPTRCLYCSFASNPIKSCSKLVEPYLQALKKEIISIAQFIKNNNLKIQCIYFGGGTPTSIDENQFDAIIKVIYNNLVYKMDIEEFTVECGRPDSITEAKLKSMKDNGVHRISINPQTMNDDTLNNIGRHHSSQDVIEKFNLARKLGFDNINMDIIVGLEKENYKSIDNTCNEILKLSPDSLTVHGLSIKRASRLHENIIKDKKIEFISQDEINKMYKRTVKLANDLGMRPYYMYRQKNMFGNMENIGYSKPSKEGLYNIMMIEEKQTIVAAGADAVSKVVFLDENRIERFGNVKDVTEYISRIDEMIDKKIQLLNSLYNKKY